MKRKCPRAFKLGQYVPPVVFAFLILLAACTVRFAPDFDRGILNGLIEANEQTLVLFATVSAGVTSDTFQQRETTYNGLIGKFDAVRVQALSRPTPRPIVAKLLGIGTSQDSRPDEIEILDAPTAQILETVIDTLTMMRDTDADSGLARSKVEGFKRSYEASIDQALTYEKALER